MKNDKEECCGACCWFKFEDTDGNGVCPNQDKPIGRQMHCGDTCATDEFVSNETKRHYMAVLMQHNRWRRSDSVPNHCRMVDVSELGKAIDFALKYMRVT